MMKVEMYVIHLHAISLSVFHGRSGIPGGTTLGILASAGHGDHRDRRPAPVRNHVRSNQATKLLFQIITLQYHIVFLYTLYIIIQ